MNTPTAASVPVKEPFGAKRILLLVFGGITVLVSLALLASGGAALWGLSQRDDGFFTSGTHEFSTSSYALASESLDIGPDIPGWLEDGFATVRIEVTSTKPVFIGIGPVADVGRYLADVEHAQITDFDIDPFSVSYRALEGTMKPAAPASQNFWRAQATGSGRQTISWPVEEGTWSVVAMNADAARDAHPTLGVDRQRAARRWCHRPPGGRRPHLLGRAPTPAWSRRNLSQLDTAFSKVAVKPLFRTA
jgi:hypothetical protein